MKTIRRLIHREALFAVAFVTAGFLALIVSYWVHPWNRLKQQQMIPERAGSSLARRVWRVFHAPTQQGCAAGTA